MEKTATFKFTQQQLKKINGLLPKGYKFVVREELQKKDIAKITKKKPVVSIITEVITPPQPASQKTKALQGKDEQFEPKRKYVAPPPSSLAINLALQGPSQTSQRLLQKIRRHQAFNSLFNISKIRQSDLSLHEIEERVLTEGDSYKIDNLEGDIQKFCMMIYKNFPKTTSEYREAADLQSFLANLIKFEKSFQVKKIQPINPLIRSTSNGPVSLLRRRTFPSKGSIYQPLTQIRAPVPSQKRVLGQMIKKLPSQSLQQVCYIVYQSTQNKEYIFDLDTLHVKKFRELEQYVKKCMQKTGQWEQRNFDDQQFSNESQFVIDDDND